jgi:hypothetical protein
MFRPISPKLDIVALEESILRFWKTHDIFHETLRQREGQPEYVFYEGPPTANGKPGVHHVLARAFKDVFPRYKTMRGFHVIRRGGWDTHGLPVEIEVEKQLGFNTKREIEAYGIARFNELCRKSAFTYIREWEKLTERIAFWVDLDTAYITYTNDYIESVWWILKNFWERNLLYQGFKVVPYCPRCGTPLSDHEVALGYDEATDPSVYVRLPLVDEPGTSLLIWTTTPWTLPANVAVAARVAQREFGVERVLIVDWDVHHGNGTEAIFDEDPTVAFFSTHQYPFYPGTGAAHSMGRGPGRGTTLNVPLPAGVGDEGYEQVFESLLVPFAHRFRPDLILVSAGYDAHWRDPLAMEQLSLAGYAVLTRQVRALADALCRGRLVVVLEGGYDLDVLAHAVLNTLRLLDDPTAVISDPFGPAPTPSRPVAGLIAELRALHNL